MDAHAAPVLAIFEKKHCLEIPLFQRQYVWNQAQQWEPLWEDLARKFVEYLDGRTDAPVHFLGAMVLDQKQTPTTHVERRQVIDGQQRLATLQIFLAAFRDFCRELKCDDLANEIDSFILNKGMMANPAVDKFKVWPTQVDRVQFTDVVASGSRASVENKYPLTRRPYARKYDPRPRMVEAYIYFCGRLAEFFVGTASEPAYAVDKPLALRLEESFKALKSALMVVVIDLDNKEDDAQVIFETLNARGEPLLPADLLRNYIFLRAARHGEPQEELYNEYWKRFDDPFWRQEVRQGRLSRPRSDLFMQHFLASRQTIDIPVKHLFVEYKFWIQKEKPFATVREELAKLAQQGEDYRRLLEPKKDDVVFPLVTFLKRFDISTAYPLLLHLFDAGLGDDDWRTVSRIMESYLLRRAVCGLTNKNYNRIFLALTRILRRDGTSLQAILKYFMTLTGDSTVWPRNEVFQTSWQAQNAYHIMQNPQIVHILRRLNDTYFTNLNEQIDINSPLTVEHILPQNWQEHWPLLDGSTGLTQQELWEADPEDARAKSTTTRNAILQTMGNLTILTQPLNSSVSNSPWDVKRPALLGASLLPINQQLYQYNSWDEEAIGRRSKEMFEKALLIWPGPDIPKASAGTDAAPQVQTV